MDRLPVNGCLPQRLHPQSRRPPGLAATSPLDPNRRGFRVNEGWGAKADAKAALSSVQKNVCAESPVSRACFCEQEYRREYPEYAERNRRRQRDRDQRRSVGSETTGCITMQSA
jgi:hypothetical protein